MARGKHLDGGGVGPCPGHDNTLPEQRLDASLKHIVQVLSREKRALEHPKLKLGDCGTIAILAHYWRGGRGMSFVRTDQTFPHKTHRTRYKESATIRLLLLY